MARRDLPEPENEHDGKLLADIARPGWTVIRIEEDAWPSARWGTPSMLGCGSGLAVAIMRGNTMVTWLTEMASRGTASGSRIASGSEGR